MPDFTPQRALISTYDKAGVLPFARGLVDLGVEVVSSGGTAALLTTHGVPVTPIEAVTGVAEMLDGRVKTLHPMVHAAILADRDNPGHMRQLAEHDIRPIDLVAVNLYPFAITVADPNCELEQAVEMIDIGGPCMLRAAAKNHGHVIVVPEPGIYDMILERLRGGKQFSPLERRQFAARAFALTSVYDQHIERYLADSEASGSLEFGHCIVPQRGQSLRYGENPHQQGTVLPISRNWDFGSLEPQDLAAVSYNNFLDADAALGLCRDVVGALETTAVVYIKHGNPCGVGIAASFSEAYRRAYLGDPRAAMGGILAHSGRVGLAEADTVLESLDRWGRSAGAGAFFVDLWLADSFDDAAIERIRSAKKWGERVRLVAVGNMAGVDVVDGPRYRSISGALLAQEPDTLCLNEPQWQVATRRPPSAEELADLRLSWLICKHTKSNAVTCVRHGMLIGNGAGQMSRVMSCRVAKWLAEDNGHAEELAGAAAASDAFFPFRDGPELLLASGVTALIQPGGSKRDADTIAACDEHDAAMILTGTRHFRH